MYLSYLPIPKYLAKYIIIRTKSALCFLVTLSRKQLQIKIINCWCLLRITHNKIKIIKKAALKNLHIIFVIHTLNDSIIWTRRKTGCLLFWVVKEFKHYDMKTGCYVQVWHIKLFKTSSTKCLVCLPDKGWNLDLP